MTVITREDIRKHTCTQCKAAPGKGCKFTGPKAFKKMREGQSHFPRMQAAQKAAGAAKQGTRTHYAVAAEDSPSPVCPTCGQPARDQETKYGVRSHCCGLWSWDRHPLVSAETHKARSAAHEAFDVIWKNPQLYVGLNRRVAYSLLAEELGIEARDCHMKLMDLETALRVPEACVRVKIRAKKIPF